MDLLSTYHTIVHVVDCIVFEIEGLVFGSCARRTIPTMGQLKGNKYSFVVLSPFHNRGDCGDASDQLTRELGESLDLFIINSMVCLVGGLTEG